MTDMIGSAISNSLAGIASATRRVNAAAESIATSGVDTSSKTPANGVSTSPLVDPNSLSGAQGLGDVGALVDLMQASQSYKANVAVLKTANRVEKTAIDMLG
jgi:hypothetical protein